ncbi:MAG: hypothetical protein RIS45_337 [Planctomycetota bacterium]|jgi:hypothetical protein
MDATTRAVYRLARISHTTRDRDDRETYRQALLALTSDQQRQVMAALAARWELNNTAYEGKSEQVRAEAREALARHELACAEA